MSLSLSRAFPLILVGFGAGCSSASICGELRYDPSVDACVCPDGYETLLDEGLCRAPDGSTIRLDGGTSSPDAGGDVGADAETCEREFFRDADGDGFGDPNVSVRACTPPAGYVDNSDDCDDDCAACFPGAPEVCDGMRDESCSGTVDDGCECQIGSERPCPGGSDVGACMAGIQSCEEDGWSACIGSVGPSTEVCDGVDNDCDDVIDGPAASASCGTAPRTVSVECSGAQCVVAQCSEGWANCDESFSTGCESRLGTVSHCSACGHGCRWSCAGSSCNDPRTIGVTGGDHLCATRDDGRLVCWGNNEVGQLGTGATGGSRLTPAHVLGIQTDAPMAETHLSGVAGVASRSGHTCAWRDNGSGLCWGTNSHGQLGTSNMTPYSRPRIVLGLGGVREMCTGTWHSCARLNHGIVRCWGDNQSGQVGDGTNERRLSPVEVRVSSGTSLNNVTALACGDHFSCATVSSGRVFCWGANSARQLGNGSTSASPFAVEVTGVVNADSVVAGNSHACAVVGSGSVRCWGSNTRGQLGDGTSSVRTAAVSALDLTDVSKLSSSHHHTCALRSDGEMWCWGSNQFGGLALPTSMMFIPRPTQITLPMPVEDIGVGAFHSCAIDSGGELRCWGAGTAGQLGDGTGAASATPLVVAPPSE